MTASYTNIGLATPVAEIKAALNAKSLITNVEYETTEYLIFTTPLLAGGKVVKLRMTSGLTYGYIGDAWTSGYNITNEFQFHANTGANFDARHLVADTDFFAILDSDLDHTNFYQGITYVGALENGDELVFGVVCSASPQYSANNRAKNLTDGVEVYPITWHGRQFSSVSGKILTTDLMWCGNASGVLEENGDGTPAGTVGLKVCSLVNDRTTTTVIAGSCLITGAPFYMHGGVLVTRNSLILEFS